METAQQLVRSLRLRGGGLSVSAFAVGGGVSRSEGVSQPPSPLLLEGPRALRHLLSYALKEGCRGVVLHLNNLENLSASEAQRAADVLRGVRDQVLLLEGLHLILVGKTDAVRAAVLRHPQVRSVFAVPLVLSPLGLAEVELLLQKRYEAQWLETDRPWTAPVEPAVIQALYGLFRGDLRAMLQTLEGGIISLFTAQFTASQGHWELPASPREAAISIGWDTLQAVLRQQQGDDLQAELGPTLWGRLQVWAAADAATTQTQNDLQGLWGVSQAAVSQALQELQMAGAVEALPRSGTDPTQYLLTGTARLALLPPS